MAGGGLLVGLYWVGVRSVFVCGGGGGLCFFFWCLLGGGLGFVGCLGGGGGI